MIDPSDGPFTLARLLRSAPLMDCHCLIEVVRETDLHIVCVAGRLTQAHVADLLSAASVATGEVRLNLVHLVSADSVGLEALRRIRASGAAVVNAPRFIQLVLDSATP